MNDSVPRYLRRRLHYATIALLLATSAGCGSTAARSLSTNGLPGTPIVTFPNSYDQGWNTVISSQPFATQAGIDGRALTVSVFHGADHLQDNLTMDLDGNVGIRGVYKSVSTRKEKWGIKPYDGDALALIRNLPLSTFRYNGETASETPHIGFIAENAPTILSGRKHDSFNLNNSIGISLAATKQLDRRLDTLSRRVVELERLVRQLQAARTTDGANGQAR
jgi:hypothetical protein